MQLLRWLSRGCAIAALISPVAESAAIAQTELPDVNVIAKRTPQAKAASPRAPSRRSHASRRPADRAPAQREQASAPNVAGAATPGDQETNQAAAVGPATRALDAARERLLPRGGAGSYAIDARAIDASPRGANATIDKVLLQAPGVTQDSAVNGGVHVRNEHANVQYRINGILLPEGVAGFGQVLDTSFVRSLSLVVGALPAQYGLRTAGLVDIVTKGGARTPEGSVSVYGGSHRTATTAFEYGGSTPDGWDYFAAGRYRTDTLGIENPTPNRNAIHDLTRQGSYFLYAAKALDDTTRLTLMSGAFVGKFQIPNTPLQEPQFTAFGISQFNSSALNENQIERGLFNVAAVQKSVGEIDAQLAVFSRYSSVHFTPDPLGDLIFNGVASDVRRTSLLNGVQGDAAWRVARDHTLRAGFMASFERTRVVNSSALFPLDDAGDPIDAPYKVVDQSSRLGWTFSSYAQDEWRLTDKLVLNAGLRFDQFSQYVAANQLSPRLSLVFKPTESTTFHAGYARYFSPPPQILSARPSLALYANTTQQPEIPFASPVRPERSHYIDIGVDQRILPGLDVGVSAYFKRARNLLDDGQFGQALVLSGFNYDTAYNTGVELKAKYESGNFRAYGNLAWGRQRARFVISNQYLFAADEYSYIAGNYIYTDHAQTWSGSAGASYLWDKTRFSVDMIYGSGLRAGFANTQHLAPYAQVNAGIAHEIQIPGLKATTLRFDVVNLFDHIYQIRDGSGIGVFAPQYGPRRAFYAGLTQKF
jgi:outer membrane receptor protein involved in Fe transport